MRLRAELLLPLIRFKAGQPDFGADQEGAFDQVSVLLHQLKYISGRHIIQLVFDSQFPVIFAGSVQQPADVTIIGFQHFLKFCKRGWSFSNGQVLITDVLDIQPFKGIAAGGAFGIGVNFKHLKIINAQVQRRKAGKRKKISVPRRLSVNNRVWKKFL